MDDAPAETKRPVGATGADGGATVKLAVTDLTASIVTEQLPVPTHAPDQPVNVEPLEGVAVILTTVPLRRFSWHELLSAGHVPLLMPQVLVTVPLPVPPTVLTVNKNRGPSVAADTSFE